MRSRATPAMRDPCLACIPVLDGMMGGGLTARHPTVMATPISISIPHQLGRTEARRRIESGFASIVRQLPGSGSTCIERWDGDRLTFSATELGQTVSGVVDVLDAAVTIEIQLPSVLGLIANGIKGRLRKAGQLLLTKK